MLLYVLFTVLIRKKVEISFDLEILIKLDVRNFLLILVETKILNASKKHVYHNTDFSYITANVLQKFRDFEANIYKIDAKDFKFLTSN